MTSDGKLLRESSVLAATRLGRRLFWQRRRRADDRERPLRIVLFGLFGCGNLGNDGSLEVMVGFLREALPDARLICVCDDPEFVARSQRLETRPISWSRHLKGRLRKLDRLLMKVPGKLVDLAQTFREIRGADVMIVPGTGILDDFGERPYGMPLDIFRWSLLAVLAGSKVAFVSIGAGPIGHPVSRWLMKTAARLAHYRSYRDTISRDFMAGLGIDTSQDYVTPDVVFKLETPSLPARVPADPACLTVGVGVMNYYGWYGFARGGEAIFKEYIDKLSRFVTRLLDEGHSVRLLTGEIADEEAVESVRERVRSARPNIAADRILAEPSHSLHDLMAQIAQTDLVVATRFHNVVCSLKLGKPTISLGYARKNDVLMAEMGLAAFCQHVERFDLELLLEQFSRLALLREQYERRIQEKSRHFRERLEAQDEFLLSEWLYKG